GATPLFPRQPGLSAVERLGLGFRVDAEDHGMGRRIGIEANDLLEFVDKFGIIGDLERAHAMRLQPVPSRIRRTEYGLIPTALAIASAVQWVASCGGAWLVSANDTIVGLG